MNSNAMPSQIWLELEDGSHAPITNMFDCDGDETDDPEHAFSVVAQLPDGRWLTQEVIPDDFEVVSFPVS
ncbi:hypothetical protein [Roseibium sp. RKSG952]|uniref:hypothetical protein n=1 Tax=Roseibium sp. RKSG952 TaxID=2529384 RepID=UPI0012BB8BEE|nr:hypothetical protein [Roseibium sp. RKSG952]MTH96410.1 hypothetical protein [Roseibium sp. RKSG952]